MKTKRIVLVLCLLMIMGCLSWLTGCTEKKPATPEEFKSMMSDAGLTITDATDQITDDYITTISLAVKEDYQIEYYEFSEDRYAASAFNQNKSVFESYINGVHSTVSKNIGGYAYYSLVSDGECYILARVDNTLLYAVADAKYKSEIADLFRKLGY